jgi:hypothetical protein
MWPLLHERAPGAVTDLDLLAGSSRATFTNRVQHAGIDPVIAVAGDHALPRKRRAAAAEATARRTSSRPMPRCWCCGSTAASSSTA